MDFCPIRSFHLLNGYTDLKLLQRKDWEDLKDSKNLQDFSGTNSVSTFHRSLLQVVRVYFYFHLSEYLAGSTRDSIFALCFKNESVRQE